MNIESTWREKDYVEQLIMALRHPEPQTPMRAAWILGQLRDERAVAPLTRLLQETRDVYLARAVVEALGSIGSPTALASLRAMRSHPAQMVRDAVDAVLSSQDWGRAVGDGLPSQGDVP